LHPPQSKKRSFFFPSSLVSPTFFFIGLCSSNWIEISVSPLLLDPSSDDVHFLSLSVYELCDFVLVYLSGVLFENVAWRLDFPGPLFPRFFSVPMLCPEEGPYLQNCLCGYPTPPLRPLPFPLLRGSLGFIEERPFIALLVDAKPSLPLNLLVASLALAPWVQTPKTRWPPPEPMPSLPFSVPPRGLLAGLFPVLFPGLLSILGCGIFFDQQSYYFRHLSKLVS